MTPRRSEGKVRILDGGIGTWLIEAGLPPGQPPDVWNLLHPDRVEEAHRAFALAGAGILLTNTFGANRPRLAEAGAADRLEAINRAGVALARKAAAGRALVAADLGPIATGHDEAAEAWREQAAVLVDAGVDLIVVETIDDLRMMREAIAACNAVRGTVPLATLMTFTAQGVTRAGDSPAEAALAMQEAGSEIVGANCSEGPDAMIPVIAAMGRATDRPIAAKPSAGLPDTREGRLVFPLDPATMADAAERLHAAGAAFIGGCCGATPAHIAAMAQRVGGRPLARLG